MGLKALLGSGPVALDTALFIYYIEEHEKRTFRSSLPSSKRWQRVSSRPLPPPSRFSRSSSFLLRSGNAPLAARYEAYLTRSRGLRLVDIGRMELRTAAQLRAVHPALRTPDAILMATALSSGCRKLVTNDRRLPSVPGLDVVDLAAFA